MKRIVALSFSLVFYFITFSQEVVINYATIGMWEGGELDVFYNESDFDGHNFGTLGSHSNLNLKSGQVFVAKTGSGDIVDADMYYRIYKDGDAPGDFINVNLPWHSEWQEESWLNQLWWNDSPDETDLNILLGLNTGTYFIEIYFQIEDGNEQILYLNNDGQNFRAQFMFSTSTSIAKSRGASPNSDLFELFPNPADEKLSISFNKPANVENIKMINSQSSVVYQGGKSRGVPGTPIDISIEDLDAGTYFVRVQTENGISVQRIVIAK